jgi:hypothetical protein
MTTSSMPSSLALVPSLEMAWQDVDSSFERFCLTAGIGAIEQMLCEDAQRLGGAPHSRGGGRVGHRWGRHLLIAAAPIALECFHWAGKTRATRWPSARRRTARHPRAACLDCL